MIETDDPRHGTNAGYVARCRDACCREAHAAYRRGLRSRYYLRQVDHFYIDATGTRRRIRALQALGWRYRDLDVMLGHSAPKGSSQSTWSHNVMNQTRVHVDSAAKVAALYKKLCMTLGPSAVLRSKALAWGWPPPLSWNNIDDPDEKPAGQRHHYAADYDSNDLVDEATVLRILAGETLRSNQAERHEVMRRWLALGNSERSLCIRMGWKDGRYVTREGDAA